MTNKFGVELQERLDVKGMRPAELARQSGVKKQYISRLLNDTPHTITGAPPNPERETVKKLAKALDWNEGDALLTAGFAPERPLPKGGQVFQPDVDTYEGAPTIRGKIAAGTPVELFESNDTRSADAFVEGHLPDRFYMIVDGRSMEDFRIFDGDMIVARKERNPRTASIVIAELNGEFTVKRYVRWEGEIFLESGNPKVGTRKIELDDNFAVWGVVTFIVHKVER